MAGKNKSPKKLPVIRIAGKEYPCRVTMGAMVRFKQLTGRDISAINSSDIEDMVTFIWCCMASACRADCIEFPFDKDDFADFIEPDTINSFYSGLNGEDQKKMPPATSAT